MKLWPIIVGSVLMAGCATEKPPIAMVVSDHRYKINSDDESEKIWEMAGYGEHSELVAQKYNDVIAGPSAEEIAADMAAKEYSQYIERRIRIERQRRSQLPRVVIEYFEPGNSTIYFNDNQISDLNELISRAVRIDIRGRTDSSGADNMNDQIALDRALSAKRYLLNQGVDERIISVNYSAKSNYISDENTSKGQRTNRRVEIEFVLGHIQAMIR